MKPIWTSHGGTGMAAPAVPVCRVQVAIATARPTHRGLRSLPMLAAIGEIEGAYYMSAEQLLMDEQAKRIAELEDALDDLVMEAGLGASGADWEQAINRARELLKSSSRAT